MITFRKQVIVTREYQVTLPEFVHQHLVEVRPFGNEYDFFVPSGTQKGCIQGVFSLDQSKCNISDFEDKEAVLKGLTGYVEKYGEIK